MSDTDEPPRVKKSFLRKIFSQAEPAPNKRPKEDPAWRPQAKTLEEIAPAAETPSPEEVVARDVPSVAAKADPSPAADIPAAPVVVVVPPPSEPVPADAVRHVPPEPEQTLLVETPAPPQERPDEAPALPVVEDAFTIEPAPEPAAESKRSWWSRLREGLSRSSGAIGTGIGDIFTKRKLDAAMLEDLEDVLIRADLGVATATRICDAVGKGRYDREIAPDAVKAILAAEVERVLCAPCPAHSHRRRQALRDPRRRRQRLGQDHHHRQARRQADLRRQEGDAGRRRHVPRRRHRPADDLGRAPRLPRDRPRAGLGRRRPRLLRPSRRPAPAAPTCC